ncbi:MAG TPA: hypothetical protein VFX02_00485 [Gammaproteobacteria bacterium]|nr:hypothetical protein [Gammaproteobacteria bacterium]
MKISITHCLLGAILCVQVAGFYILWRQDDGAVQGMLPRNIGHESAAAHDSGVEVTQIAALVRGILREELAGEAQHNGEAAAAQPQQTVDPAQNQDAYRKSLAIVDNALAAGKWRQDDNLDIMQLSPNLTSVQRIELLDKLAYAINGGALELEATPPPL